MTLMSRTSSQQQGAPDVRIKAPRSGAKTGTTGSPHTMGTYLVGVIFLMRQRAVSISSWQIRQKLAGLRGGGSLQRRSMAIPIDFA